jgi:4-hydroxythreonine-4-phosphate dehydrogenase
VKTSKFLKRKKIVITTGDVDGIGLEVTYKALKKLSKSVFKENLFFIYTHVNSEKLILKKIKKDFKCHALDENADGSLNIDDFSLFFSKASNEDIKLVLISSKRSPADWVFSASKFCMVKYFDALVTAPLSKTLIKSSGYSEIGHTEILQTVSACKNLYMLFLGKFFNVVLLSGHMPLASVPAFINKFDDASLVASLNNIRKLLPSKIKNKPFALLGLNPHAGEDGIIGGQEELHLRDYFKSQKLSFVGPLVPDAAFLKKNWNTFSIYIASYHDQGLIPFKMIHGQDSGVHITLGLPFVRTSVDHGTAKDLFGKNKANPNSMIDAITWAIKLS